MKEYKTIVADPPWRYKNIKTGGSMRSGSAQKYKTLSTEEICDLDIIRNVSGENSILFLWATIPMLPDAFRVMEAWHYKYKTAIIWRKTMSLGMGFWFRGQCEICLMGIKGKVKAFRYQESNFIQSKVRKHSQKPLEFFKLIEPICLEPKIELFAREERKGWASWGDEIK